MSTKKQTLEIEEECPNCLGSTLFSPSMRMLVSPCCHKLCDSCVKRTFSAGTAPCPVCKTLLRKDDYVTQTFEDLAVDKEVRIRKTLMKHYNKREEDFATLREYNDYLEEIEVMVFNLVNNVDVDETKARIEQFRQSNEALITRNQTLESIERRQFAEIVEQEKKEQEELDKMDLKAILEEQQQLQRLKESYIDDLDKAQAIPVVQLKTTTTLKAPSRRDASNNTNQFTMSLMDKLHASAVRATAGSNVSVSADIDAKRSEAQRQAREMQLPFDPMETCDVRRFDHGSLAHIFDPALASLHSETHGVARAGGFMPQLSYIRALDASVAGLLLPPALS